MRALARNLFLLACFGACSHISQVDLMDQRRAEYENFLGQHVQTRKLFLKLREMAAAKLLKITPELSALQAKTVPGFELKSPEGRTLFVVSIEMPDWSRFNINDFHFLWGTTAAKSVKEIMDLQLLQSLYPFAYPHDRAFILEFEKVGLSTDSINVQTSQGQFEFEGIADQ